MGEINTLISMLEAPGTHVRCFDMGRRITELSCEQFSNFERAKIPYPLPLKNEAWFALCRVDLNDSSSPPMIWFLRLPLDEQGKLIQATRDYFVHRLLEAVAQSGPDESDPLAAAFKDNPHTFKPREDRMAIFHACLSVTLQLPPSSFYAHAKDYFCGATGWDQWQFVGYQGIADISARINESEHRDCISKALADLPDEPLTALCHCLENQSIPASTSHALLARLLNAISVTDNTSPLVATLIRGMSRSTDLSDHQHMFDQVLNSHYRSDIESLVALSGRAWELLQSTQNAHLFLEALAENPGGQRIFEDCVKDLLSVPGMREPLLTAFKQPDCSALLSSRMAALKQNAASTVVT